MVDEAIIASNMSTEIPTLNIVDNLQQKILQLERELFKSQSYNKKLEYQLKKSQENMAKYGKVNIP